jgi:hypothetical protein
MMHGEETLRSQRSAFILANRRCFMLRPGRSVSILWRHSSNKTLTIDLDETSQQSGDKAQL